MVPQCGCWFTQGLARYQREKKGENKFDGVPNWNAHESGRAFHFSMGILFYKKYPQIVEEKCIGNICLPIAPK
jgi:hypothetical protein